MAQDAPKQNLIEAVVQRASLDATFRRQLLDSPATAIHTAFGVQVPPGLRIKFVERDPRWDEMYVLPDLQEAGEELSEDDLDAVAGGQQATAYRWDGGDPT